MSAILTHIADDGVASVTLNRPELHNAFNESVIADLTAAFQALAINARVRAVLLRANGPSFSAGADLDWMRRMAAYDPAQNRQDAMALATMLRTLNELPKPTIAVVQGPAFGGGVGLVAACDIAIAVETASFCLSEVKLGLIPATIGPYVLAAMGQRACRRWFLTAERFSAAQALADGLVQQVVPADDLQGAVDRILAALRDGSPAAQTAAKDLILALSGRPVDDALIADTARRIADTRASPEGREGVAAFLEKRKPFWR